MVAAPEPEVKEISFQYRYGTGNLIQVNTNLPATTPLVNFTVGDNDCSIDQSGNPTSRWAGSRWITLTAPSF